MRKWSAWNSRYLICGANPGCDGEKVTPSVDCGAYIDGIGAPVVDVANGGIPGAVILTALTGGVLLLPLY